MQGRTALITGALGQDGSLLGELLLSRGYRVVGAVRADAPLPQAGPLREVEFVSADIADLHAARQLVEKWQPDELYHLAAFHHSSQENSVSAALASKEAMLRTNFLSTRALAFALVEMQSRCHLVFAASSQMYTAVAMEHEISEASPRQPSTFYGHVKSWSADLLSFLRKESGLRASVAILFNHESPRRAEQFVSRKITRAAARASKGGASKLELQNIGARVDWSSARDVVRALSLMGGAEQARDYVVASGNLHSIRDLLHTAFEHVGLEWQRFTKFQEDRAMPALVGRPRALEAALGWQRQTPFEDMVAEMVDYDLKRSEHPGGGPRSE